MTARLNPYITFTNGQARQALEYYKEIFGGELAVNTFAEFGMGDAPNPENIMHGQLVSDGGFTIMGADLPPGMEHTPGDSVVLCVNGDEGEKLHAAWDRLADGGEITTPLEKQMWGDEFGQCTDRFGVRWMFNISQPA